MCPAADQRKFPRQHAVQLQIQEANRIQEEVGTGLCHEMSTTDEGKLTLKDEYFSSVTLWLQHVLSLYKFCRIFLFKITVNIIYITSLCVFRADFLNVVQKNLM